VRRIRRLDDRRIAGDGDAFLQRSNLEQEVDRDELLRRDADTPALERQPLTKGSAAWERRKIVFADGLVTVRARRWCL
jgi:hypothetical protein